VGGTGTLISMRLRGCSGFAAITRIVRAVVVVAVAAGTVVVASGIAAGGVAEAAGRGSAARTSGADLPGSVYVVGAAARAAARSFWTPGRMAAATGASARQVLPLAPSTSLAEAGAPRGTPWPVTFGGAPTVGTLFYTSSARSHFCTASVVASKAGNLVMTAAHCVYASGYATHIEFAPGYHDGVAPYGAWPVQEITVAKGWRQRQDPSLDYAFLEVVPPPYSAGPIQSVTGALTIGFSRHDAQSITVIGYNDSGQRPIRCATKSFKVSGSQMEFYCHSFWYGTSGGPWIIGYNGRTGGGTVFGVIGGYEAGGYQSWASYSTILWQGAESLFRQAEAGA
jgi:V8-like Glu-specific endopeptidase